MNEQPKALRLARYMEISFTCGPEEREAAAELRRLHEENERLKEQQQHGQRPVAWMHTNAIGHVYFRKNPQDKTLNPVPLYTSPPAGKPLSGYINAAGINANDSPHIVVEKLERAIEAANGITGETK